MNKILTLEFNSNEKWFKIAQYYKICPKKLTIYYSDSNTI